MLWRRVVGVVRCSCRRGGKEADLGAVEVTELG
jgi:hypothetical protein